MKNIFTINSEYSNNEIINSVNYKSLIENFKESKLIDIFGKDIQKMENFTKNITNEIGDFSDISREGLKIKTVNNFPNNEKEEEFIIRNSNNYLIYLISIIIALIFLIIYMLIKIKKKTKKIEINRINNFYNKSYEMRIKEYEYSI